MFRTVSRWIACASLSTLAVGVHAASGAQVAERMQNNFDATPARCDGNAVPAHVCSGVLIRATKPSPSYHTWHHSPNTKLKGGLSFSYLRADLPVTALAADARSGFTLYPQAQRPENTLPYSVLCAWPTDGDSWTRNGNGCGDNDQTANREQACHEQGVHTAEDWIARFRQTGDYKQQCAFDTRFARVPGRDEAFHQSLRVQQVYGSELPFAWNELILNAWKEEESNRLPIQSFFYIAGMPDALEQAQADQRDWHATYGQIVPVVRIELARSAAQRTQFSYQDADQAITAH